MYKSIVLYILIALMAYSCDENFFSTTIEVDPPTHTPKMAVHGFFGAGDSTLVIGVSRTRGLLEKRSPDEQLNDATVELFSNDTKVADFTVNLDIEGDLYNYEVELDQALADYGENVELRVTHPDFSPAIAKEEMPSNIEPSLVEYVVDAGVDEYGDLVNGVEITFQDIPSEENFFEISVLIADTFDTQVYIYPAYVSSFDPAVEMGANYESVLLRDQTFDGREYKLLLLLENGSGNESVYVNWKILNKSTFLYSKSVGNFIRSQDSGPFAEPVSIFTNMENGLGVMGLYRQHLYQVK